MGFTELTVIFTLGICIKFCASDPHGGDKWVRPGSFPQNYQTILAGIEQRLRGIDSIRHIVSRNGISLEALSNRIELIETRLTGLQSTMQHKFDAIATAVSSTEMKYELLIDQMSRKLQTDLERITHKLNSAEARLETSVNKIQDLIEINFQKLEIKQINIANEVLKVHSGIEIVKSQSVNNEQKYNHSLGVLVNHLQEIRHEHADKKEHLKNLTSLVTSLHHNKNEGWTQSDAPIMPKQQIQIIKTELGTEIQKIGAKMTNIYNDVWRNIKDLEVFLKVSLMESNNKSRELHEDLRQMLIEEKRDSESFLDVIIQSVMSSIQTELSDLKRRIDTDFQRLIATHEIHGDSCHKVKSIIENRVALILERIYETFTNRTDRFLKQITDVEQLVKSEGKQLTTAIKKTNDNLIILANENSQDHKQLDSSITDVTEKTEDIMIASQEIQMQTQETNEVLLKYLKLLKKMNELIYNNLEIKGNQSLYLTNETVTNNLKAIEANYSNGIIKILTDRANKFDEFIDKEEDRTSKDIRIPLSRLNQSVITSDLMAVIGESKNKNEVSTSTPSSSEEKEQERDDEDDFEAHEEFGEDDIKTVDTTQLLLSYIKYLRGHLSPQEFLTEAVPGSKYESLQDMAKQLKRTGNVPKEMIINIEDMAQDLTEKEIQIDKEIGSLIKKFSQRTKYETLNEDENYDEAYDAAQSK